MGYPDIDPGNFKKLSQIKEKNPSLKTLISVGGWTWSKKFSDVAFTKESRNAFADSCIDFIVEHGFDGIDIDWEYPVSGGMATNTRRPEDRQNFTLLLKTLREKLDARAALDQKYYLLTIAGSAGSGFTTNTEMDSFHQYIDYANIMTYDIHGTWDKYTDFNAPLYSNGDNSSQYKWSVNAGVEAWIAKGFPKEKIILGIPFYGHIYKFDGSTFISYEDEDSVRLKVEYIDNKGLGGAFVWELSQDPNEVLLDVISVNLP